MDAEPVVQEKEERWGAREVARFLSLSVREIEQLRQIGTLSATKRWPFGWWYSSQSVMGYFESFVVEASPLSTQEPLSAEESARANLAATFELVKEAEVLALTRQEQEEDYDDDDDDDDAHPIVKMVNVILSNAIDMEASDVYFEALRESMRVRFRVKGELREVLPIPKLIQGRVTRRVMVMADIDLARLFVPQVGTIRVQHSRRDWNLRVTTIPSLYGHTVNVRLLNGSLPQSGLEALGMLPELLVPLEDALEQKGGLFVFVGPSASGTTTTVATCLHSLNKVERSIYTIEQPVEYEFPGITQIQLNPFCGHTLDKALKTVLRARPDILFLGSIHDTESARAAVEATEAGITVLTTMRCTNIPTVFTLLERYGIPPPTQGRLVTFIVNQRCLGEHVLFEGKLIREMSELHDLVATRAPRWKLEEALKRYPVGPSLEEQLAALGQANDRAR